VTSFFDANLHHDLISGESVAGVLHQLNKTPINWCSKLQLTVETATFGSEYVAARTCTEQVIDLHLTLRHLAVPINGPTMVLGDNESVINSAAIPYSKMHNVGSPCPIIECDMQLQQALSTFITSLVRKFRLIF